MKSLLLGVMPLERMLDDSHRTAVQDLLMRHSSNSARSVLDQGVAAGVAASEVAEPAVRASRK